MTQQPKCRFFDLPAEIRNQIYTLVLNDPAPVLGIARGRMDHRKDVVMLPEFNIAIPALLSVSRQIRLEAHGLFFPAETFFFPVSAFDDLEYYHRYEFAFMDEFL